MEVELRVCAARFRALDDWRFENLAAPYWRIHWNDREGWQVQLGAQTAALGPDRLVVVPPETPCSAHSRNPAGCSITEGRRSSRLPSVRASATGGISHGSSAASGAWDLRSSGRAGWA